MGPQGLRFVPLVLALGVGFALLERAWARGAMIVAVAGAFLFCGWELPMLWPNGFTAVLSIGSVYGIRFLAAIGVGMHLVSTTSPTALGAALRAWRVPRPVAVPFAVLLRFFPVVRAESVAVLDAMRLRGLAGARGMLRHPILAVERFSVPMIAASLRASEDLAASAIVRGMGSTRRPTSVLAPHFTARDLVFWICIAAAVATTLMIGGAR